MMATLVSHPVKRIWNSDWKFHNSIEFLKKINAEYPEWQEIVPQAVNHEFEKSRFLTLDRSVLSNSGFDREKVIRNYVSMGGEIFENMSLIHNGHSLHFCSNNRLHFAQDSTNN